MDTIYYMEERNRNFKVIEDAVKTILEAMGEDSGRADLVDTPKRFAKFMLDFSPKKEKPKITTFECTSKGLIAITGLDVRSLCSHHLAPFIGKASVYYYPKFKKAGLSKFQRALDYVANKPQDQENLTKELLDFLVQEIDPEGMCVKVTAVHTCMSVRGVRCSNSETTTIETFQWPDISQII